MNIVKTIIVRLEINIKYNIYNIYNKQKDDFESFRIYFEITNHR